MAAVDLYCSFPEGSDHDFGENALRLAARARRRQPEAVWREDEAAAHLDRQRVWHHADQRRGGGAQPCGQERGVQGDLFDEHGLSRSATSTFFSEQRWANSYEVAESRGRRIARLLRTSQAEA